MSNHLKGQTSPYLLQHAENPVEWYPWCEEAFERAKREDKPVFLSIGYSTCHWCHVMEGESFENSEIADILNRNYISVKVDREERPDIDSIYMAVCQAFTGSGGWPASIFMTAEQKPFFAGTYFPPTSRWGSVGLKELLLTINDKWKCNRSSLLKAADRIIAAIESARGAAVQNDESLIERGMEAYRQSFDEKYGGFGEPPKFPMPHNLLFLLQEYDRHGNEEALKIAEKTLRQMYFGGLFDHIGYGFCRYSTDRFFLVPHFEKMLYDNALLIMAYCRAFEITKNPFYKSVAEKTAAYILNEMTSPGGGFYSAQDADSDGAEGRYYVFDPHEIEQVLGKETGKKFCKYYDITQQGNFQGKSIPNLLNTHEPDDRFDGFLPDIYQYRKGRARLHTDDKILTSWNGLAIAAFCSLYRISRDDRYLHAASTANDFIQNNLCSGDTLFVSFRNGKSSVKGFLDDYASYIFALIALYKVTLDRGFLCRAGRMADKAAADFFDYEDGGFYLYGRENEQLILRPKEYYDGAVPSGNSLMAYNLTQLKYLMPDETRDSILRQQMGRMSGEASSYPGGYAMFLCALSYYLDPPATVTIVRGGDYCGDLPFAISSDSIVRIIDAPSEEYRLLNGKTTFYVCEGRTCRPPVNKEQFYAARQL